MLTGEARPNRNIAWAKSSSRTEEICTGDRRSTIQRRNSRRAWDVAEHGPCARAFSIIS